MERDQYRQEAGDMDRNLETKEASIDNFESGAPDMVSGKAPAGKSEPGTMGDSRPDDTDPAKAEFVSAEEDPNQHVTRRTSELTEPERGLAAEMDAIRHDDTKIVARPMGPIDEEGAAIQPITKEENVKEAKEGDDS